jgi:hypothetical protein
MPRGRWLTRLGLGTGLLDIAANEGEGGENVVVKKL